MKTYSRKERTSKALRQAIENVIYWHEKYKNSYFWSNLGNASSRGRQERQFAENNPAFSIETEKGLIEVKPSLELSCRNCYYHLSILLNGEKKNIRLLKGLI